MGARTEILGSRRRELVGHNQMTVMHVFNVLDEVPEEAWKNADPPLPEIGTHLNELALLDDPYSIEVITEALTRGVQLRRINTDWLGNTRTHSRVTLFYASGIDEWAFADRRVVWEDDVTLETETIFFDIETDEPIPGGAQTRIPIVNSTATLNGVQLTLPMQNQGGSTNDGPFRLWSTGELLYVGASSRLIHGYDTSTVPNDNPSRATVQLTFMGRVGGWKERRPVLDTMGQPTGTFTEFTKYTEVNVFTLFPNGWDPGT